MEWLLELNRSLDYIEENLEKPVSLEQMVKEAAKIARCSSYHYQRMFSYLAGVTLSEYLRRRRMTLAAGRLRAGEKVLDTALRYGYDSPTAFNRTFQSIHGVSPSEARKEGVALKAYPRILFQITIKGAEQMEYRIEHKPAFWVTGISRVVGATMEENTQVIPQMWTDAAISGVVADLVKNIVPSNDYPNGLLGVCGMIKDEWRYYIGVASGQIERMPDTMESLLVPESDWAVFSGKGRMPEAIQELEKRIFTDWLPSSGYEYADAPDIEAYLSPNPQDSVFEVWLPVRKREK